ncbi:hypothetical protein ACH4YO_27925 [Streptomyces noursei]|uniref:hypothetical protein n=1 Tax=Streptomyces noursei TaxID=1971 RepID=UPI001677B48B|nr:hypothetical protein [Streptomyces noursei]MCZ1012874.1 hypothetical protein [Streptomyces noursei]GGX20666.1 hypothetical protein GCM10010341_47530 [Streptomyces noursei]
MHRGTRRTVAVVIGAVALVGLMSPQASAGGGSPVKKAIMKLGLPPDGIGTLLVGAAGAAASLV